MGRVRHRVDLRGRRRLLAHAEVDRGHTQMQMVLGPIAEAAHPERADQRRAAGTGRPALERRCRHLRQGVDRDRRATSATVPTTAVRVDAAELRCRNRGRGRQPRGHPARPCRVRARRRTDLHRRDRQLRRRRLQRSRGQHQDPARCRGGRRGDDAQAAQPAARGDDRRGRRVGARTTTGPRRWRC